MTTLREPITLDEIKTWARELPPEKVVGRAQKLACCPVAGYIRAVESDALTGVAVYNREADLEFYEGAGRWYVVRLNLAPQVRKLITRVDRRVGGAEVTAAQLLRYIAQIEKGATK